MGNKWRQRKRDILIILDKYVPLTERGKPTHQRSYFLDSFNCRSTFVFPIPLHLHWPWHHSYAFTYYSTKRILETHICCIVYSFFLGEQMSRRITTEFLTIWGQLDVAGCLWGMEMFCNKQVMYFLSCRWHCILLGKIPAFLYFLEKRRYKILLVIRCIMPESDQQWNR